MSALLPNLEAIDTGTPVAEIIQTANATAAQVSKRLVAHTTALVLFPQAPNNAHLLQRQGNGDREIWPDEDLLMQVLDSDYPRLTFPSWALYKFWKAGNLATEEQIDEEYGFIREHWLEHRPSGDPILRKYTPFNAIRRSFNDHSDADHLEIRNPGSAMAIARVPFNEYVRDLSPAGHPPRLREYASLWLPKLVMDKKASQWYEKRQAEQAKAQAEQLAYDQADELLRTIERDHRSGRPDETA